MSAPAHLIGSVVSVCPHCGRAPGRPHVPVERFIKGSHRVVATVGVTPTWVTFKAPTHLKVVGASLSHGVVYHGYHWNAEAPVLSQARFARGPIRGFSFGPSLMPGGVIGFLLSKERPTRVTITLRSIYLPDDRRTRRDREIWRPALRSSQR